MFPTTYAGYRELESLIPDIEELPKDIKNISEIQDTVANTITELNTNIGATSTFNNPYKMDVIRNDALFSKLLCGTPTDTDRSEAIQDFYTIKAGTASIGAQVLSYLAIHSVKDIASIYDVMEMYHILAQNTLDAKSGISTPSTKIFQAFRKADLWSCLTCKRCDEVCPSDIKYIDFIHLIRQFQGIEKVLL